MKEEDDIRISRYLADDLDETNRAALEARIAAEPELAAELKLRRQELTFLRTEAALPDLQSRMEELGSQHFGKKEEAGPQEQKGVSTERGTPVRRISWKHWAPAVGIAAAVALVLLVWNPFSTNDGYEQFAQYAPVYLTEKSSDAAPAARPAETAFNAGNYALAYDELTTYLTQRPDDNEARLALGIAALETGRDAEAQTIFTGLSNGSSVLKDDAQFYLALAYFKAKDPRAKAALLAVGENNPDYGVRVRKMLQLVE